MSESLLQSMTLFLLIAIGYAAGKLNILGNEVRAGLAKFLVDFTLPSLVIISMQKTFSIDGRNEALGILGISICVYALSFPLAFAWAALIRAPVQERGVHRFAACFSNVGFMGFPVMEALFGKESLFTVSIYNIPFQVLVFSIGIIMVAGRAKGRSAENRNITLKIRSFINPAVIAALLGFIFFLCSIKIPEPIFGTLRILGDTTTPLSMALIGAMLSRMEVSKIFGNPRIYATTVHRLIILPLALYVVLRFLGAEGFLLAVPVMIAAMPVAANTSILATVYGGDTETASSLVFISSLASLLSIPLLANLLFGR